jgi:hypothetical protein
LSIVIEGFYAGPRRPLPAIFGDAYSRRSDLAAGPLAADLSVDELTDEVRMAVVARVLLNHVNVDPPERTRFTATSHAGVFQTAACGGLSTLLALRLPEHKIAIPVSGVERDYVAVLNLWVVPNVRSIGLTLQDPPKPRALYLGHVTDETVKGEARSSDWTVLARLVVEAFDLEEQGCAVELEPCFEHLAI